MTVEKDAAPRCFGVNDVKSKGLGRFSMETAVFGNKAVRRDIGDAARVNK